MGATLKEKNLLPPLSVTRFVRQKSFVLRKQFLVSARAADIFRCIHLSLNLLAVDHAMDQLAKYMSRTLLSALERSTFERQSHLHVLFPSLRMPNMPQPIYNTYNI